MKKFNESERISLFYVVQFLQLPQLNMHPFKCVPNGWIVLRGSTDRKVFVAYPREEDPFKTRHRAEQSEKFGADWEYYLAVIRYESDTYYDSEMWIATISTLFLDDRESYMEEKQPEPSKGIKKSGQPQSAKEIRASNKPHLPNNLNLSDSPSQSCNIEFSPVTQDGAQGRSMPLIDMEDSDHEIVCFDTEDHAENITEHRPPASQPPSTANQSSENVHGKHISLVPLGALLQQPRRHQKLVEGYNSCKKASHTSVPQTFSNLAHQHVQHFDDQHEQTNILAQPVYSQQDPRMQDKLTSSIETHGDDPRVHFKDLTTNGFVVQISPNSTQFIQNSHQNRHAPVNEVALQQAARKRDQVPVSISVPSAFNSLGLPNQSYPVHESLQRQFPPSDQYPQGTQQIPGLGLGILNETNGIYQQTHPQGVMESVPPTMPNTSNLVRPFLHSGLRSYSLRDPRIQARLREKLNAQQHVLPAVAPQNMAMATSNTMGYSPMQPIFFSNQPPFEAQIPIVHENRVYQIPRVRKPMVDKSTETISTRKRTRFVDQDNVVNVMDQSCQTDEFLMDGLLSLDQEMSSDYNATLDYEMCVKEAPVGTINGNGGIIEDVSPKSNTISADKQVETKIDLNQQRIIDFLTLSLMNYLLFNNLS